MTSEDIQKNQETIKLIIILIIVVIVVVAGKSILNSILEGMGLKDSAEDKKRNDDVAKEEKLAVDFFKPAYYKNLQIGVKINPKRLSKDTLDTIAKNIYDSIGALYDSPEQAKAAFAKLNFKVDVSKLADRFAYLYGKDLLTWISDKLDTDKQKTVWLNTVTELNKLPSGFIK